MFVRKTNYVARFIVALLVSVAFMLVDYRSTDTLQFLRDCGNRFSFAIYGVVQKPFGWWNLVSEDMYYSKLLRQEVERLRNDKLISEAKQQRLFALEQENDKLRSILRIAPRETNAFFVAQATYLNSDPYQKHMIIDHGRSAGAKEGEVVVDTDGIVGTVFEVREDFSTVLLVTDPNHAIPVETKRTGIKGIVVGDVDDIKLDHVPRDVDVQVGDMVLTSGLGGKYPVGYPVGTVSEVIRKPESPFADIKVKTEADVDGERFVLVLKRFTS